MPERSALPLPQPQIRARTTGRGNRPTLEGPGAGRQAERLEPSFTRLTEAFEQGRLATTAEPAASPEQVLVLEIAGELDEFAAAVRTVPGLEFLAEDATELAEADDEFAAVDREGRRRGYPRQLFLIASDEQAWRELLRLWEMFQDGQQLPRGKAKFRHLFSRLRELRAWNDRDRLERTGVLEAWERELREAGDELIEFEVELWARRDETKRTEALARLRADLREHGGDVVAASYRPEISYLGVLARVRASRLRETVESHEVQWMHTGAVRFFHAVGQLAAPSTEEPADGPPMAAIDTAPVGVPRIALLDGVPLTGHTSLDGRIVLDDPEGWGALTPAERRVHGTAMASVVLHGDLAAAGTPLSEPLHVRPILWNQAPDWVTGAREELPRDRLAVDVVHSAFARMLEGEDATAPAVKVIVFAVGDTVAQFDRFVSPLARLLDWLQYRYRVLVLVSAGNQTDELELPADIDLSDPSEVQHETLCSLQRAAGLRRLLSPAESVNAITVGAAHSDASGPAPADGRVEPLIGAELPAVCSALGAGVRRAVKPDVLLPGGRQLLLPEPSEAGSPRRLSIVQTRRAPGVLTASPGGAGTLTATAYGCGTSPATALAGHHAGHALARLDDLRSRFPGRVAGEDFDAVLVKGALVHCARWGSASEHVDAAYLEVTGRRDRDGVARMVGYGNCTTSELLVCDDHRVTAVAANSIEADDAHAYRFPLPPGLSTLTARRRLTLTLAWQTPINPDHRNYRRAALKLEPMHMPSHLTELADVGQYSARRGTVQHVVREGQRAVPFGDGAAIELLVSCRADAGELVGAVPYALFVTLEVAPAAGVAVYQEVRQKLQVPVAVQPRT